jgi:hypothetical protein
MACHRTGSELLPRGCSAVEASSSLSSANTPRDMAAACVRRVQCCLGPSRVMASSQSLCTSAPAAEAQRPKKPSPYRLLTPDQRDELLPPLRAQGWRVQPLASASQPVATPDTSTDTEQEELVGTFAFRHEHGRVPAQRAWRSTLAFVQRVGEIVEAEDVRVPSFPSD